MWSFAVVCLWAAMMVVHGRGPTLSPPSGGSFDDIHPIEVLHVYGCDSSSNPRRETYGCRADGSSRLTVRGRRFIDFGNRVTLHEALETTVGDKLSAARRSARISFDCEEVKTSSLLPSHIMTCTIPSRDKILSAISTSGEQQHLGGDPPTEAGGETLTAASPQRLSGNMWFDVKVASGWGKAAGILRRSVQIHFGADPAQNGKPDNSVDSATTDSLESLRNDDWQTLGIGGLGKPLQELFRRAFSTRTSAASAISSAIGIPHVKGIILHGPPGTGKTLVARTVAKLLNAKNVQVVNGPEIMSKFVGDSEKNLRTLFSPAEEDYTRNGQSAGLHVLIFDEIDAILRPRGEGDDSAARAVYDGVTTQMLAVMDGIHTRSNILIIGLTNRLDALDKALLRPGRFEVQIRIPLPDEEGRRQIFAVHTKSLKARRYLSTKVDFAQLAADTSSFSGADISGVVRSAISFALERFNNESLAAAAAAAAGGDDTPLANDAQESNGDEGVGSPPCASEQESCDPLRGRQRRHDALPKFLVEERDLRAGVKEILAAKGSAANLAPYLRNGLVIAHNAQRKILVRLVELMELLRKSKHVRRLTVSLYGPPGSGTTALAALAARLSRASFTQLISINALNGLTSTEKIRRLAHAFDTAAHVPTSFIILDKLEDVLEMNMGRRPNDRITTDLIQMIQRDDAAMGSATVSDAKSLVLVVTSRKDLSSHFGPLAFDVTLSLDGSFPSSAKEEVLCAYGVARDQRDAQALVSVLPASLSLKRLVFLIHATVVAAERADERVEETTAGALFSDASRSAAEAGKPIIGDVSSSLFLEAISNNGYEGGSLCEAAAQLHLSNSEPERSHRNGKSTNRAFLTTAREFGAYATSFKAVQDGKRQFDL